MKKIFFVAFLALFLMSCATMPERVAQARGPDYFEAGNAAYDRDDFNEAIRLLTKAIDTGGLSPQDLAEAYHNRGLTWDSKGNYDQAIVDYTKSIKINPKAVSPHYNRGNAWKKLGVYDRAIADYTKAIEMNPRHSFAYNNRGNIWYAMRKYDRAIADFNKALEIKPNLNEARENLQKALEAKEKGNKGR